MRFIQKLVLLLIIFLSKPNSAELFIDMNPTSFGETAVDSVLEISETGKDVWISVVISNIQNLDTYTFKLDFDPNALQFNNALEDDIFNSQNNFLKSSGGVTCCWSAQNKPGITRDTLEVVNTLIGMNVTEAPDGFGVLAAIRFTSLLFNGDSTQINIQFSDILNTSNERVTISAMHSGWLKMDIPTHLPVWGSISFSQSRNSRDLIGRRFPKMNFNSAFEFESVK